MIIVIGILLANAKRGTDVPLEIAKGLISLEVAILITGVLSYFLSERVRKQAEKAEEDREVQAKRAEEERLLVSALQDLKSAYSKVQVVQFRLRAERSPMRLSEQIPALIEPRAQLQHL